MKNLKLRLILLSLVVLTVSVLVSCSKFSVKTEKKTENTENLPDMIMVKSSYTFGEKGRRPIIMEANKITIFTTHIDKTELEGVRFYQEETMEDGTVVTELSGCCDSASVTNGNSLATMKGNINLYKKTDNFTIICDNLVWDDKNQKISTEGIVDVQYEDGTTLKAERFSAQLDDNVYEFGKIIEGRYESEK